MKLFKIAGIALIVFLTIFLITQNQPAAERKPVEAQSFVDREKYFDYSDISFKNSEKNGKTLLFFAAGSWCNTCSALDDELSERANLLPEDVTVLKVDYDNNREMKKKYEVVTQHTLVLLDSNGTEITRWVGGNLQNLINKIKETEV